LFVAGGVGCEGPKKSSRGRVGNSHGVWASKRSETAAVTQAAIKYVSRGVRRRVAGRGSKPDAEVVEDVEDVLRCRALLRGMKRRKRENEGWFGDGDDTGCG